MNEFLIGVESTSATRWSDHYNSLLFTTAVAAADDDDHMLIVLPLHSGSAVAN